MAFGNELFQPVGSETGIDGSQNGTSPGYTHMSSTQLPGGGFVVSWMGDQNTDVNQQGLWIRTFDAAGQPVTDPVLVESINALNPDVVAMPDGSILLAYQKAGNVGFDLRYRIVSADLTDLGVIRASPQMHVGDVFDVRVAKLTDVGLGDKYVIAWNEFPGGLNTIKHLVVDPAGVPLSSVRTVTTAEVSSSMAVVPLADGGFAMAWSEYAVPDTINYKTLFQVYDAAGVAVGNPLEIGTGQIIQDLSGILMPDGRIAIAWQETVAGQSGFENQMMLTFVSADHQSATTPLQVEAGEGDEYLPQLDLLPDGNILLTWSTSFSGIKARVFLPDGSVYGSGFGVLDAPTANDDNISTLVMSDGSLVISWAGQGRVNGDTLSFQRFEKTDIDNLLYGTPGGDNLQGTGGREVFVGRGANDWITPGGGHDTVVGGAGTDMVSFVDLTGDPADAGGGFRLNIDLGAGSASNGDGSDSTTLQGIENVTGTVFPDLIRGTDGANWLRGSGGYDWFVATPGQDTLDGGSGRDMVSFLEWQATEPAETNNVFNDLGAPPSLPDVVGVVVDLAEPSNNTNLARGLEMVSIERVTGSSFQDVFFGDDSENDFRGMGGYDWFVGSAGGRERYYGGSGIDTVTYFRSLEGVVANLSNGAMIGGQETGRGSRGDAARDLYFEIENLVGTAFDDVLTGSSGRNQLSGLDGDDILFGEAGTDFLKGGAGDDTIFGGSGSDYAVFDMDQSEYTITKTGARSAIVEGLDGTDTITEIEYLRFGDGDVAIWDL